MPSNTANPNTPRAPLDVHFARLMMRLDPDAPELLYRSAMLASEAPALGHVCVPSEKLGGAHAVATLRNSKMVGAPGDFRPLILDEAGRLYLHRYWKYEEDLVTALVGRLQKIPPQLFDGTGEIGLPADTEQRLAIARAATLPLSLISGGPGSGKTYVAALALLEMIRRIPAGERLRIALAAPTGKAAARLREALDSAVTRMQIPAKTAALLPTEATTLHRLLGITSENGRCTYHHFNPLPADVILVDEASMVDLPMMAKLFAAARDDCRVILLGDRNQLSSVEAGHVFGDLAKTLQALKNPAFTQLAGNYRSGKNSEIAAFASAINDGATDLTASLLTSSAPVIAHHPLPRPAHIEEALEKTVLECWGPVFKAAEPVEALHAFNRFRILCALRAGAHGVIAINRMVESILRKHGFITEPFFQHGRPVLVLRNDYQLGLSNGDLGMTWKDASGQPHVFFQESKGVRSFSPARLPEHETAFAMTVHKSQGSEFEHTLVILPNTDSPILTRELLYTAVTRAKSQLGLWADLPALHSSISRQIIRWSGLQDKLRIGLQPK